ncbi:uncharacterized protein LOC131381682 isoform X1 [Hylobates moloch]|uniref:uncharacterized protein LOC131381682 isoform X1 n=1 Tax=Hylobates moloch TaxID=81572 RepID=UPI002675063F|nr:uncharacterized protein LOC131381682 isoform X1 [Hylobates moloch]
MGSTGTSPAARSPKGPTRMMKPQAESGGSSVASKPQACPDGVRVSLPRNCAPEISRTVLPACLWAVLSPEGHCHREQNPAAAGVAWGIKWTTLQPRTKAAQEHIVRQERSGPMSKMIVPFLGPSL